MVFPVDSCGGAGANERDERIASASCEDGRAPAIPLGVAAAQPGPVPAADAPGGGAPASGVPRNGGLSARQLARVLAYVDGHLGEPVTLHDLAGAVGLSVFHLARSFKARTGVAPHQYLLRRRLLRARELLGGTALPVGEIALRCGFSHASHFTSTFQRVLGTTPTRWRRLSTGRD